MYDNTGPQQPTLMDDVTMVFVILLMPWHEEDMNAVLKHNLFLQAKD